MIIIGNTSANVEIIAPGIPKVLNPAKVAIFSPIGPGVKPEIAINCVNSKWVNQLYLSQI